MNSTVATILDIEEARVLLFGAIGVTYTAVGTPLIHPARMLLLQNHTDAELWVSNNGVKDKFSILPMTDMILDIASNQSFTRGFFGAVNETIYIKQKGVPTTGDFILAVFYGEN